MGRVYYVDEQSIALVPNLAEQGPDVLDEVSFEEFEERLRPWFGGRTVREAVDRFSGLGIPINAVNDVPSAAHEPQLHERELLVEVPDPVARTIHVSGKNIKLSRSESVVGSAPLPGQHTEEILTGLLGCTPQDVDGLEAAGAVYRSPPPVSEGGTDSPPA